MPAIIAPTSAEIATWEISEQGPRKGEEPTETLEVDNNTCTRTFWVKYEHRFAFARWCIGYSRLYVDTGQTILTRLLPQFHEDPDAFPEPEEEPGEDEEPTPEPIRWPFTKVVEMRGHKWLSESPAVVREDPEDPESAIVSAGLPRQQYELCKVTLLAEQVPFDLVTDEEIDTEQDRYVEYPCENTDPSGEYLQLPGAALIRVAEPGSPQAGSELDGKTVPQNIGKVIPQEVFKVRWHRLPIEVWDSSSELYKRIFGLDEGRPPYFGAVSSAVFYGRPEGTVLLTGVRPFRSKSPLGVGYELMLEFEFTYRPAGWNWVFGFLVAGGAAALTANGWYHASADGTFRYASDLVPGSSIYDGQDMNNLFNVGLVSP
jgi:hypothetical protein